MRITRGDKEITKNVLNKLLNKIKNEDVYNAIVSSLIYLDVEI